VSRSVIRFGPDYRASLSQVGYRSGSQAARSVNRTIRALAGAETLPGPDDGQGLAPATGDVARWAYARLVPRAGGLWLWYVFSDEAVTLLALTRV